MIQPEDIMLLCNQGLEMPELPHTKDERRHPHNGRLVPITPELREILDHANNLPGKSEYTFHIGNCETRSTSS